MAFKDCGFIPINGLSAFDLCLADGQNTFEQNADNCLVRWKAVRAAISKLKSQGFFCIQDASNPEPSEFLWALLTFCYAKKIFGSNRIVQWL